MKNKLTINKIVIIVLIAIFCFSFIRQEIAMNKIQKQINEKQEELQKLKEANEELKNEADTISSDQYIEKQARERLGMIKPGEKVVIEEKGQ
ncbi:FtsB family cell division protein [Clostridium fallax]|uniref:Cell division protein FtsL n=1 Tax=Clostridium fallax TaxID=1533 RepID=A0A1M4TEW3_9CLOT|nr:septum formation initiator family protein [Clostridium fallax]SHE42938.1 cell division protein FtsL [Clostridium fallax]SQB22728.1 cell division protein [Clostridium fallax]